MLAPLNSTMLAVALPDIRQDLHVSHSQVAWLVSAYLIAMAVAQPVGGRLGDQIGRARTFRGGLVAFLAFSLAAAVAPNFLALIACRTGQAVVGAAIIPNGMAMLRSQVPARRLAEANGLTGSALGFSAALGPVLGAGLLAVGSWRWLFTMNLPLVAAAFLSFYALGFRDVAVRRRPRMDLVGMAALTGLLVDVTFLLGSLRRPDPLATAVGLGALLVLVPVLLRSQFKSAAPVAEWSLFRLRSFAGSTSYVLLSTARHK